MFTLPRPYNCKEVSTCSLQSQHVRYQIHGAWRQLIPGYAWCEVDENSLPTLETYLCGSMAHSNSFPLVWGLTDSDISVWWVLKAARRLEHCRPRSGSEAAACQVRRLSDERRKSTDGEISTEKEQHTPRRQLSLRRHRWYHSVEGGDSSVEKWRILGDSLLKFYYYMGWCSSAEISGPWLTWPAWPDPVKLSCGPYGCVSFGVITTLSPQCKSQI